MLQNAALVKLLQLASPALPVGAYSYSEGLETLVEGQVIATASQLETWIERELRYGIIVTEAAVMVRGHQSFGDRAQLEYWNAWLSASRETRELRQQSWQMGQSLLKLSIHLQPELQPFGNIFPCNYAIAYGIIAAQLQIDPEATALAYLQSWATNFITAGIKLIPLGQTAGQQILFNLNPLLLEAAQKALQLDDSELGGWSWGVAFASMGHETQYTRLFRS
ncbi:urease accessory protein UreF [Lusitaniella coriacea LEGE 07157]|uniref:Urease accessory protein UreF n=1 Tax=Lusitaniella coriacea LEGE 07157 TaxID=945747 RepID=A0A8J7DXU0_9CYAN|nr:urease accessory protein UreF [Lusitaniella coriacea]MBE9117173.1 urease accessory protein UreF [Lusitaniella coriacea LEGE 07157]